MTVTSGSCSASSISSSPMVVTPSAGLIGWMQKFGQGREVRAKSPSITWSVSWMREISFGPDGVSTVTEAMSGVMLTSSATAAGAARARVRQRASRIGLLQTMGAFRP